MIFPNFPHICRSSWIASKWVHFPKKLFPKKNFRVGIDYLSSRCIGCNIASAGGSIHGMCTCAVYIFLKRSPFLHFLSSIILVQHFLGNLQHVNNKLAVGAKIHTIWLVEASLSSYWNENLVSWFLFWYIQWILFMAEVFIVFIFCGSVSLEVFPLGRREGEGGRPLVSSQHKHIFRSTLWKRIHMEMK